MFILATEWILLGSFNSILAVEHVHQPQYTVLYMINSEHINGLTYGYMFGRITTAGLLGDDNNAPMGHLSRGITVLTNIAKARHLSSPHGAPTDVPADINTTPIDPSTTTMPPIIYSDVHIESSCATDSNTPPGHGDIAVDGNDKGPSEDINISSKKHYECVKKKVLGSCDWRAASVAWNSITKGTSDNSTRYSVTDCQYMTLMAGACATTTQCERAVATLCMLANADLQGTASCILQSVIVFYLMRRTPRTPEDVDSIVDTAVRVAVKYLTDEAVPLYTDELPAVWQPTDLCTREFTRRIYTAYTERLCDIHASLADSNQHMGCISYVVYMLQIIKMAAKTQAYINLEKVFSRLHEQLGGNLIDYPLLGAIIGTYTGATYLRRRHPIPAGGTLIDVRSTVQSDEQHIYALIDGFMSATYGPQDTSQ